MAGRNLPAAASLFAGTASNQINWRWFARLAIPSPVGPKRFCDYSLETAPGSITTPIAGTVATAGTVSVVGAATTFLSDVLVGDLISITGESSRVVATVTDNTHLTLTVAASTTASGLTASLTWTEIDMKVGALDQGSQGPLSISYLDFSNIQHTFGNWAETPGLRCVPAFVYQGQFNLDNSFAGFVKMYAGMVGGQSHGGKSTGSRSQLQLMPYVNPHSRNGLWLTARDFGAGQFMPDRSVPVP